MKINLCLTVIVFLFQTLSWGGGQEWESQGNFFFLAKNTRESFSATGPGPNKFSSKYLNCDGVDFLVKGADSWPDYGRLNLGNNNMFHLPIPQGMKIEEIHFLASGNYGNSYEHDGLLRMYGENYYYAVLTLTIAYEDGTYKILSAPVFWDWFHLPSIAWSKDGAKSKAVGVNPVRKDCTMYHISFSNPKSTEAIKDILVSDSWLSDRPFSDVFAVTIKSSDTMPSMPKKN